MRLLVKEAIDREARLKVPGDTAREHAIRMEDRLCRECPADIPAERPKNAAFCSETCRKASHREYDRERARRIRGNRTVIRLAF